MKTFSAIILIAIALTWFSCAQHTAEKKTEETGLIGITRAQFQSEGMEMGAPLPKPFTDEVRVSGKIVPSVNGSALVSAAIPGVVRKILVRPGQPVARGTALIEVSGNELVELQGDFAASAAALDRLKSEYERVQGLFGENIATKKELIQAESAFKAELARYSTLRARLSYLGLDAERVQQGHFSDFFNVTAPIAGRVVSLHITPGQHIEPQMPVAEIMDPGSFQLLLPVFGSDIAGIRIGKRVGFHPVGDSSARYLAVITSVGMTVDPGSKTVDCHASLDHPGDAPFVGNQLVEAVIILSADTLPALPETAVLGSGNDRFVLCLEKEEAQTLFFKKVKVEAGRKGDGWISVNLSPEAGKVLVKGLYNLKFD